MQDSAQEAEAFRLEVAVRQGVARVRLAGQLDMSRAPRLDEAFAALYNERVSATQVEASAVTFIDCVGLRSLLVIAEEMKRRRGVLRIVEASAPVRRLLELSGCEDLLEEAPSPTSAEPEIRR